MSTGVIRISAALFALALLVGVFAGLNTQPTQAVKLGRGINSGSWASVPRGAGAPCTLAPTARWFTAGRVPGDDAGMRPMVPETVVEGNIVDGDLRTGYKVHGVRKPGRLRRF